MRTLPLLEGEAARVAALRAYGLLDTGPDPSFDAFVGIAAHVCDAPIALVNLVDATRQYFKAKIGVTATEVPRQDGFCGVAVSSSEFLEIPDATLDPRFADNRLVAGEPYLRFYAGMPLTDRDGHVLGTLCVIDYRSRTLTDAQRTTLQRLAESLVALIDARRGVSGENLAQLALLSDALEYVASPVALLTVGPGHPPDLIAFVNHAFSDLFGYAPTDVLGKRTSILRGPLTDAAAMERLRAAALDGKPWAENVVLYTAAGVPRIVSYVDRPINASHRIVSLVDLTEIQTRHDALEKSNERLQSLLANNTEAVLTIDKFGTCLDANVAAVRLFGRERAELVSGGLRSLAVDRFFPGDSAFPVGLAAGRTTEFTALCRHADGRELTVECRALPMIEDRNTVGAYVIAKDVTESNRLAALVSEQAKRTHALYLISAASVAKDEEQIGAAIELVLESFGMQYGFLARVEGETLYLLNVVGDGFVEVGNIFPLRMTRARAVVEHGTVVTVDDMSLPEHQIEGVPDYPGWHAYIAAPLLIGGKIWGAVGFCSRQIRHFNELDRDFVRLVCVLVSSAIERRMQNKRLDDLAYLDTLTGLPNRAKFMLEMDDAIARAARDGGRFAVHFIDLDGFKNVNDRAGHAMGDLALREVAERLRRIPVVGDVPARLGGDEFVVLQKMCDGTADVESLANRVVSELSRPYDLEGGLFDMGASVGVAVYPKDGTDASALLRHADVALYRAKARGKRRVEFSRGSVTAEPLASGRSLD